MAIDIIKGEHTPIRLWAPVHEIESSALDQLKNVARLPTIFHLAVMPDVHAGKGCTVGSVIATKGSVSPATVGVDIGCGMAAVRTNLKASQLPDNLDSIYDAICAQIPVGFNAHEQEIFKSFHILRNEIQNKLWDNFSKLHPDVQNREQRAHLQLGTLGGGNHFIELCVDENQGVWITLHSGSRNIGKEVAEAHIKIAKTLEHNAKLPDPDLAYFLAGTKELENYRFDLYWCQEYARYNRALMLGVYMGVIQQHFNGVLFDKPIFCHHNYVAEETHFGEHVFVTRKGAIQAQVGTLGIIPGSMGTKSYIVEGLGCAESLNSASHGAGRRMSRGAAKRMFTIEDLKAQTLGVKCRKDAGVVDEIPAAYKNIDQVMESQKDLVKILHTLRAVLCVKG